MDLTPNSHIDSGPTVISHVMCMLLTVRARNTNNVSYFPMKMLCVMQDLIFKRRIKSRLPFAGIISSPYSTRFQVKG